MPCISTAEHMKPSVVILGIAQDGGVPQCGCSCYRCMLVHEGGVEELYPVSLGLTDSAGGFHLVEASRTLCKQLYLWSKVVGVAIPTIQSVTITHGHLGHIDGIGLFGKEVMGKSGVSLYTNKAVLEKLERSSILYPFNPFHVENGQSVCIGPGIKLEFLRIPHRDFEIGETHAIICRGQDKSFLFLPDHDTWSETLASQGQVSLRCWLQSLEIDFAFIDGTFFVHDEMSGTRKDFTSIPHPSIEETLKLLGAKTEKDPDVYFIHLNHTNSVLTDSTVKEKIRTLGWKLAEQGVLMTL